MLQQLSHPNIVKVMDVIEVVDATYIVMERIDGPELTDYLAAQPGGRLDPHAARAVLSQMLAALRHAHARGFVHCDLKPSNIRMTKLCDRAVLTDWGFARKPGVRAEAYYLGAPGTFTCGSTRVR